MSQSIVIADDHPLMVKALTDFLILKKFRVIAHAADGGKAYSLIVKNKPDIAILDIQMPVMTGLEVAHECKKNKIPTKIILITFSNSKTLFKKALFHNVAGYILKEFALKEVENCIDQVANGKQYFSPAITEYIQPSNDLPKKLINLSPAEYRIASLIAQQKSSKEIAGMLNLSINTINKHRCNIIAKLNLGDSPSALAYWATENREFLL